MLIGFWREHVLTLVYQGVNNEHMFTLTSISTTDFCLRGQRGALQMMKSEKRRGIRALHEIQRYQSSTELLISKAAIKRVVDELCQDLYPPNVRCRLDPTALNALQEAAEDLLVELLEDTKLMAQHRDKSTITSRDMQLAWRFLSREIRSYSIQRPKIRSQLVDRTKKHKA
ncbi:uncharacterized protein PAC_14787 [Phialocephala subalpina]|uniref:Core Histone H2A/H2B/H3 domain-containing protein n=1 Tax=Phialocephala subalpina TaxID=576137 RepID=A0A1L7XIV6_9HELO|nr:uncharacterized protein PAC_14787 [Phialocephala subalpina]